MEQHDLTVRITAVLEEVFQSRPAGNVFLDDAAPALLHLLDNLNAEEASAGACGSSVAAHARHIVFSLAAYRKAIETGDAKYISDFWPDWDESPVTEAEWIAIRAELEVGLESLSSSLGALSADPARLSSALGAIAHSAFHLGAIQVKYDIMKG